MVSSRMLSHTMATNVDTEVAVGIPKLAFTVSYVIIHLYSTHSMCFISLYASLHLL
jgi:hypothetical protein